MGKRASMASHAKPAKRQSVASPGSLPAKPAKVPDPLGEVFQVLKKRCDKATSQMLVAVLPLALKESSSDQRHDFQERMLDHASKVLSDAVASQKEAIAGIEQEQVALTEEKGQGEAKAASIASALAEKKKDCQDTEEVMKRKQAALEEAQGVLQVAKKNASAADGERKDMERNRDDFVAGRAELFQPLKASETLNWRERNKMLIKLVAKLQTIGIEASLLAAIQTALKIKVDARGEFAQAAVTCTEEAYMKYIDAQQDKIEAFGFEIEARGAAVADAEAGVTVAQEAADASVQANIDAQNAWAEEDTKEFELRERMEAFEPAIAALQQHLQEVDMELGNLVSAAGVFVSQRSGKQATEQEVVAADVEAVAPEAAVVEAAAAEAAAEEQFVGTVQMSGMQATEQQAVAAEVEAVAPEAVVVEAASAEAAAQEELVGTVP